MSGNGGDALRLERDGAIAEVVLNRPDQLNALGSELTDALAAAVETIANDRAIRVVIVAGDGKAFCAGADIAEFGALPDGEAFGRFLLRLEQTLAALEKLAQPTIAAVHGVAYGGGMELALACDLRVADERARFGLPEVKLGILPGAGGTQRAPRTLPRAVALEMILTGEPLSAADAHRLGFVNRVAPTGEVRTVARELAARLAVLPPLALAAAKRLVWLGTELSLEQALILERDEDIVLFDTADRVEGTSAFLEKRTPQFRGE